MKRPALFLLDEREPLTPLARVLWSAGLAIYAAITAFVATRQDDLLQPVLWVPVAHALVVASTCGYTAVLLAGQATMSGRPGYLWLSGTYLYVGGVLLMFPLFFPGAFVAGNPLLGAMQSAPTLFYAWHLAFPLGLGISIVMLRRDQASGRRSRRIGVWHMAAIVALLLGLSFAAVWLGIEVIPAMVEDTGQLTPLSMLLDEVVFALSLLCVAVAAIAAYGGTHIQRWLLAVSVLLLGESVINLSSSARWTFAWYFDRLFGMVALTALFFALLVIVARAGRTTTIIAASDSLTEVESRAHFTKAMSDVLAATSGDARTALLWIDLDGFKAVNDELGHVIGDEVLRISAQRIQAQVRDQDQVGRLGGDEFGVLMRSVGSDHDSEAVAERILASLRDPISIEEDSTLLTCSIGIATAPGDAATTEDLLLRADLAMYAAKNAGGDRWTRFSAAIGEEALERAKLRHRLAEAVRAGEFDLDVQPIVTGRTATLAGYEALVRWQCDSERIGAEEFIGFAERSGQIIGIGHAVVGLLERWAGPVLSELPDDGFLAFNMSLKEIADPPLIERLCRGPLAASAGSVVIEITESQELLTSGDIGSKLDCLRAAGYRIALDDFGAGFSNFSRLEHLHPQLLKVDRLLVRQTANGGSGGLSFLSAALGVAKSLGCEVVVEGVETEQQAQIVASMDVRYAQGELFGRPLPLFTVLQRHEMGAAPLG